MRIISEVKISIIKKYFPDFINGLYKSGCELQKLTLIEKGNVEESYNIEIAYNKKEIFNNFLELINQSKEKYKIISITNTLEDKIKGGLVHIAGKMPFENINDYYTNILGATDLIFEKIKEGDGIKYTSITKNVALISGIKVKDETKIDSLYYNYAYAERASVIINRFTTLNAQPLLINFDYQEDLLTTIQRIEHNFSVIKLLQIEDADISFYDQIYSNMNIPVVSEGIDDIPIYLLTMILKISLKNKLKLEETTIGFIGINISAMRLTRLLIKMGCFRVLGCDYNEKLMFSFENQDGLATNADNIFNNADIIILLKKNYDNSEYQKIRPGQFIISMISNDDVDMKVISDRGVREFIHVDVTKLSAIIPGILNGIINTKTKVLDDFKLINFSKKLVKLIEANYEFPDIFSNIHETISNLMNSDI